MSLVAGAWLVFAASAFTGDGSRLALVELAASGPLERATLECRGAGRAELELDLGVGDTRRLVLPLPTREGLESLLPASSHPSLIVVGRGADGPRERALAGLPPNLRLRPAPPAPLASHAPSAAAALLVLAAAFFVARLRSRPGRALACGATGALAVLALELGPERPRPVRVVLDFEVGAPAGVGWRAASDELDLGSEPPLALYASPPEVELELEVDARGEGPPRCVVRARGASLCRLDAADAVAPEREENRYGTLSEVWSRTPDGAWTFHGEWRDGQPLPDARRPDSSPPGWVLAGLPQGRALLVARDRVSPARLRPPAGAGSEVWLRVVGP